MVVVDGQDKLQDGSKVNPPRRLPRQTRRTPTRGKPSSQQSYTQSGTGARQRMQAPQPGRAAGKSQMSPSSRSFCGRSANTLLMVGILLVGFVAYRQLPVSALPQVDYPTIQVQTFYPGASPDRDGVVSHGAARAPIWSGAGLNQMTSTSSYGSSIITLQFALRSQHRCGRARGASFDSRRFQSFAAGLPNPPIYSKINPATLQSSLGDTSKSLPLSKSKTLRTRRWPRKFPSSRGWLVSISGGQRPAVRIHGQSHPLASYGLSLEIFAPR